MRARTSALQSPVSLKGHKTRATIQQSVSNKHNGQCFEIQKAIFKKRFFEMPPKI